jgi:hypothetical protein
LNGKIVIVPAEAHFRAHTIYLLLSSYLSSCYRKCCGVTDFFSSFSFALLAGLKEKIFRFFVEKSQLEVFLKL